MDIIFLSDDPVNSKVIEPKGDKHVYDISTVRTPESRGIYSTTTVRRPSGEVGVGQWEWSAHNREQDRITYLGVVHTLAEWLPKERGLSRTRLIVPANGKSYRWKQTRVSAGSTTLEFIESNTSRAVARAGYARIGSGFSRAQRMRITVQPEAAAMLDVIVLSLVVLEEIRRERGEATSSAGAGVWDMARPFK
ncbi:hypothetical protein C8T65DRAFT_742727 [Cerioporus squamosus]|nr:hypothetical protein C8T65DRAFT_742727 [Cerioporus squamosus]